MVILEYVLDKRKIKGKMYLIIINDLSKVVMKYREKAITKSFAHIWEYRFTPSCILLYAQKEKMDNKLVKLSYDTLEEKTVDILSTKVALVNDGAILLRNKEMIKLDLNFDVVAKYNADYFIVDGNLIRAYIKNGESYYERTLDMNLKEIK